MKQNIVLADCVPEEVAPLAENLHYAAGRFEIKSYIANWKRTGAVSEIKRYGKYFLIGFYTFLKRKNYNAIVGWQQFYALIFCFCCEIFRVKKQNTIIALNFTYKEKNGIIGKIYGWFMKKCVSIKYLDYVHVLSEQYADTISSTFSYPRERILVSPFGVNDDYEELSVLPPEGYIKEGYALAIGRSNRDYDFLIRAWEGVEFPLVIISDTYKGNASADNITVLRNVAGQESYPWISNCGLMILPIDDGNICSGDTVLLTAMALKRKIIVTVPSTLSEMYIVNGENALLSPKDESSLKQAVYDVLYSKEHESLGERARNIFLEKFSRQSMGKKISEQINL